MQEVILTEDELRQLCAEYQRILRLQDWRVRVKIGRPDPEQADDGAYVTYNTTLRVADILIVAPEYYPTNAMMPQDMEIDLVHELVHLYFALLGKPSDDTGKDLLEAAIESIAEAVVNLRRDNHKQRARSPRRNHNEPGAQRRCSKTH